MNGHKPMTPEQAEMFDECEHVEVIYTSKYRCKICGYTPETFGCYPKMHEHLKEVHGIEPSDENHGFWFCSYYDSDIKKLLD